MKRGIEIAIHMALYQSCIEDIEDKIARLYFYAAEYPDLDIDFFEGKDTVYFHIRTYSNHHKYKDIPVAEEAKPLVQKTLEEALVVLGNIRV